MFVLRIRMQSVTTAMSRRPRLFLPDTPFHVVQRGNNRLPCFFDEGDYRFYRHWLKEYADHFGCAVHAYVLMTNHIHLLLTPSDPQGPSRLMQFLGMRYVTHVNRIRSRTGSLWEGRFRASPVETDAYLSRLYQYIELNPVRAGMVQDPADHRWSSHRRNAFGIADKVVTEHPLYTRLGSSDGARREAYRRWFASDLANGTIDEIRKAAIAGLPIGGAPFLATIEQALGAPLCLPRGRRRRSISALTRNKYFGSDPN
jgi:putative transposase